MYQNTTALICISVCNREAPQYGRLALLSGKPDHWPHATAADNRLLGTGDTIYFDFLPKKIQLFKICPRFDTYSVPVNCQVQRVLDRWRIQRNYEIRALTFTG